MRAEDAAPDAVRAATLPINEKDEAGRTAFLLACYMGQTEVVRALLQGSKDLDVDMGDLSGRYVHGSLRYLLLFAFLGATFYMRLQVHCCVACW